MNEILEKIHIFFHNRTHLTFQEQIQAKSCVHTVIEALEQGTIHPAMESDSKKIVHIKEAILLYFFLSQNRPITPHSFDKIPLQFQHGVAPKRTIRIVPGAVVRRGAYIGNQVVLMPCFINIGAYVGEGTMIDTWATVGSCAYVGKQVHISGGVGIGGVLEPMGEKSVIIEDNCFVGARSEIAEGVVIKKGSVLSMGVYLSQTTKIIHQLNGDIMYGVVPAYSVVVPGTYKNKYCVYIVKTVDERTRSKTTVEHILRTYS